MNLQVAAGLLPNARQIIDGVFGCFDLPRESIPSRSRGFGLRDPVMAGNSGSLWTQQTQVSNSSKSPVAGFPGPSGFGSGRRAAVSAHLAANVSGGWSASA